MIFFLHCSFFIGFIVHSLQTFEQVHPDAIPTLGDRDGTLKCRWPTTGGSLDLIWSNWLMSESRKVHVHTGINFPQQQNLSMGSLAQISSGAIRCSFKTRFRGSGGFWLVQIPCEVPEGSGEDTCWGSGGFCAVRVPVQIPCEVPEGSGAYLVVRFRKFPVQVLGEVPEGYGADTVPCEVPEGSGANALWNSKGFWCFLWHKHLIFMAYK